MGATDAAGPRPIPESGLLSMRQAAAYLGVSPSHFRRELAPRLPCVWLGGQTWRYRKAALDRWIAEHEVYPPERTRRRRRVATADDDLSDPG